MAGVTQVRRLPSTPGAFDPTWNGGTGNQPSDGFVGKLNPAGDHFDYLTFLGGSGNDEALGVAVDVNGQAYVTGFTESDDFPATVGAFRTAIGISHHDGFLLKLNADGSGLVFSTFLGSNGATDGLAVAVDAAQHAYVAGNTWALNLPSTPGAIGPPRTSTGKRDAFLVKFDDRRRRTCCAEPTSADQATTSLAALAISQDGRAFLTGLTRVARHADIALVGSAGASRRHIQDERRRHARGSAETAARGVSTSSRSRSITSRLPLSIRAPTMSGFSSRLTAGSRGRRQTPDSDSRPIVFDIATDPGTSGVVLARDVERDLPQPRWRPVLERRRAGRDTNRDQPFESSRSRMRSARSALTGAATEARTWAKVLDADAKSVAIDPANPMNVVRGKQLGRRLQDDKWWIHLVADRAHPASLHAGDSLAGGRSCFIERRVCRAGQFRSAQKHQRREYWQFVNEIGLSSPSRMSVDRADANAFYIGGTGAISRHQGRRSDLALNLACRQLSDDRRTRRACRHALRRHLRAERGVRRSD